MAETLQTTFSNALSRMKICEFRVNVSLKFVPMMISLLTHICDIRPHWVTSWRVSYFKSDLYRRWNIDTAESASATNDYIRVNVRCTQFQPARCCANYAELFNHAIVVCKIITSTAVGLPWKWSLSNRWCIEIWNTHNKHERILFCLM